jgi:hypothetical protein
MQVIFMDESGYSFDWKKDLDKQPYYVLSAVCLPSKGLHTVYQKIRNEVSNLCLEGADRPIGQGFEIKARDVATGSGYWRAHKKERDKIRNIMLTAPKKCGGTAFVVVIDKQAHLNRYVNPSDPYLLSLRFIFERLQMYLREIDDHGICIYDQNERIANALQSTAADLIREGSELSYFDRFYELVVTESLQIDRIIEFSLSRSENSIGLQIADFFATMTYTYVKDGKPSRCSWWDKLKSSLHRKGRRLQGVGYKEFP